MVTKKASHPNTLLYNVQLERARKKYLVQGQLDDGKEGTVALGSPDEQTQDDPQIALQAKSCDVLEVAEQTGEGSQKEHTDRQGLKEAGEAVAAGAERL
jgi:hypothetical protein